MSEKELNFKLAQEEYIDNIFAMYKDAINEMKRNGIDQWDDIYPDRSIIVNDINRKQLYTAISDGIVVAAYVLNQECDKQYANGRWRYPNSAYYVIHRLCVNPIFQNKRIGSLMLLHIENEIKRNNSLNNLTIRLDAFTLNPYAIKMYDKLGYEKVGFANWRKGKFYLMEKKI